MKISSFALSSTPASSRYCLISSSKCLSSEYSTAFSAVIIIYAVNTGLQAMSEPLRLSSHAMSSSEDRTCDLAPSFAMVSRSSISLILTDLPQYSSSRIQHLFTVSSGLSFHTSPHTSVSVMTLMPFARDLLKFKPSR